MSTTPAANESSLYLSNLAFSVTSESLTKYFSEALSTPNVTVKLIVQNHGKYEGKSKGYGFLTVPKEKEAAALALTGKEIDARPIGIQLSNQKTDDERKADWEQKKKALEEKKAKKNAEKAAAAPKKEKKVDGAAPVAVKEEPKDTTQVFVSGFPFSYKAPEYVAFFTEKSIPVVKASIIKSNVRGNRTKDISTAFVTVDNAQVAAILALNDTKIDERTLKIELRKAPVKKEQKPKEPQEAKASQPRRRAPKAKAPAATEAPAATASA